jgi:hypothetical protein|eukprot:SAG25_NODE_313_length_9986_cov_6.931324_9_plen_66_part_00
MSRFSPMLSTRCGVVSSLNALPVAASRVELVKEDHDKVQTPWCGVWCVACLPVSSTPVFPNAVEY